MKPRYALLMLLLLFFDYSHADYHYVSHSGSDAYPYTSWATAADSVADAVAAADPGDTVYIASGEYEGLVVMYPADSLIAIIGAGMDSTHLFTQSEHNLIYVSRKTYLKGIQFSTVEPNAAIDGLSAGLDFTVEDCRFGGAGYGIITSSSNVIVNNCIFDNLRRAGIAEPFSTNVSLEVSNCLFRDVQAEPINVWSRHAVVKDNIVLNALGYSSFSLQEVTGGYIELVNNVIHNVCCGGFFASFSDTLNSIENNIVDKSWHPSYAVASIAVPDFNAKAINNSLTDSAHLGLYLTGDYQLSVHYSNSWNIADADFFASPNYDGSFDTTLGLLHVDPMFVDSSDFHLQAFSPLIDAGDPNILDVDGTRSDIGAYGGPGGSSYVYQDLPPRTPDSLVYRVWNDTIYLDWRDNYEADFFGYQLHRDVISDFIPSPLNLVAEPESSLFVDSDVVLGQTYYYRIASLDNQGNLSEYSPEIAVEVTGVWQGDGAVIPRITAIEGNYPNPFNSTTTIVYSIADLGPIPAEINIGIYDIMGRKIRTLVDESKEVGVYRVIWDGRGDNSEEMPSGTYFVRISQWGVNFMSRPRKLILVK